VEFAVTKSLSSPYRERGSYYNVSVVAATEFTWSSSCARKF